MRKYILVLAIFGSLSELFGYGCYSSYVSGLNRYGDNFLAVRTGPSTAYRRIDILYNGDRVLICDGTRRWRKIFYGSGCYISRDIQ